MKKRKQWLAMGLSVALAATALTGCAQSTPKDSSKAEVPAAGESTAASAEDSTEALPGQTCETKDYSKEESLEISLAIWGVEDALAAGDEVLQNIENRFNIRFVPENITWDDYEEKIQLWAASGSLPDVFAGAFRTTGNFQKWAQQGLIKEIPEDLSFYPTLQKYMESDEKDTCMVDEKVYCIFRQTFAEQSANSRQTAIAYRWDLAQEAGITKEPENWEEFADMIQAIIAADPEKSNIQGMTVTNYEKLTSCFLPYSNAAGTVEGTAFYWVDNGNGTYVPAYFAGENLGDNTLPALKLLRSFYEKGIIESDVALASKDNAQQKFLNGQSAALLGTGAADAWENVGDYWEEIHEGDFWEDVKFLNLLPDQDGEYAYAISDYAWSETYINSSVDDEKMERILAVYDYLLTDEGAFMGTYGIEGKTFDFDQEGVVVLKDGVTVNKEYPSTDIFSVLVRWNPNTYDKRFPAITIAPAECTEADDIRQERAKTFEVPEYDYSYTVAFQALGTGFSLNVPDDVLNITMGEKPVEDMWEEVIANYRNQGLDSVIEQVNEAVKK